MPSLENLYLGAEIRRKHQKAYKVRLISPQSVHSLSVLRYVEEILFYPVEELNGWGSLMFQKQSPPEWTVQLATLQGSWVRHQRHFFSEVLGSLEVQRYHTALLEGRPWLESM